MVFLIQNTQNRDNDILHLKIDELIRATEAAQNATLCLDKMASRDLRKLRDQYSSLGGNDQVNLDASVMDEARAATYRSNRRPLNQIEQTCRGEQGIPKNSEIRTVFRCDFEPQGWKRTWSD